MLGELFSLAWRLLTSVLAWLFSPVPLAVIAVTLAAFYFYMTKNYNYWKSRGIPGPKPTFPWGTEYGNIFEGIYDFHKWMYNEQGGKKYCGYIQFAQPVFYTGDLDLIRSVTIKDFEHFTDRNAIRLTEEFDKAVFILNGQEWKETRSAMTPTFSASKLRSMHQLCLENAQNLGKYMREEMRTKREIELKDSFGRFTMDNIASCAFGVNTNSFTDPNSEFAKRAAFLFEPPTGFANVRLLLTVLFGDWLGKYLPDPSGPVARFFVDVVHKTRDHREKSQDNIKRNDFLQLLLDTRDKQGNRVLTDKSITAQCVLFFIVGYDTTASLLTFCGYCLATEPEWQAKVQDEIDQVLEKYDGKLTYDAVAEMTTLDNVLSETLRLYPPAGAIERKCSKDYKVPNIDLTIPRGMLVQMPVLELHRDPELFPDPLKFNPDRFLPEAKEARHPCAFIPFGAGPRNCIAMRFALFEAKVALIAVLRENKFEPGPSTPAPPMPIDKKSFILRPKEGCGFVRVVARD